MRPSRCVGGLGLSEYSRQGQKDKGRGIVRTDESEEARDGQRQEARGQEQCCKTAARPVLVENPTRQCFNTNGHHCQGRDLGHKPLPVPSPERRRTWPHSPAKPMDISCFMGGLPTCLAIHSRTRARPRDAQLEPRCHGQLRQRTGFEETNWRVLWRCGLSCQEDGVLVPCPDGTPAEQMPLEPRPQRQWRAPAAWLG